MLEMFGQTVVSDSEELSRLSGIISSSILEDLMFRYGKFSLSLERSLVLTSIYTPLPHPTLKNVSKRPAKQYLHATSNIQSKMVQTEINH